MLAGLDGFQRVRDAGAGIAGRLDHHLDPLVADRLAAAIDEARARNAGRVPAHGAAGRFGALEVAVGDHRDFEAADGRHLCQKHRAEFSGADQSDAHRFIGVDARGSGMPSSRAQVP